MAGEIELIAPAWPAPARVRAAATARAGGVSRGPFATLNLANHVGDDAAAVQENRRRLARQLSLPSMPLWLHQVHGATVVEAGSSGSIPEADAMIARAAGQVCAVLTADCLPVLFCDEAGTRVAAAHAGWRGLAAGVLEAAVAALNAAGAPPAELLAWLGPAIGGPAYEVGAEVRDAFPAGDREAGITANVRGRWQLDLAAIARRRLAEAGVWRVYGGVHCTASEPERFFSYRRDGACGRQATLIWLESAG